MRYDIPILIIAFNRPEVSKLTFEVIKQLKPYYLYVAVDGARKNVDGESSNVEAVMSVYHEVNWPCQSHYKKNAVNMGAEITVSNAVSWVLSEHTYCIVLEDDVLASQSFFEFAKQMLLKYEDNEKIYQVSAAQFTPIETMSTDYVFSIYGHTGFGWATWRRAWNHFSFDLNDFDQTLENSELRNNYSCKQAYNSFLKRVRKIKKKGSNNCSWDMCWSYIRCRDGGFSIVPRSNLSQNIGLWGLHAHGKTDYHKFLASDTFKVKKHPSQVAIDFVYDKYHFKKYIHHSILSKIKYKLVNILSKCQELY